MGTAVGWEIVDPVYYGRYGYPHASWAWLRRHAPVAWFEAPGMLPFWAITKYDDCSAILRDHRRFLIAPRIAVFPEEQAPTDAPPFRRPGISARRDARRDGGTGTAGVRRVLRQALRRSPARAPGRFHHHARQCAGRRRTDPRVGAAFVLRPPHRRRQRDHAQRHVRGPARADGESGRAREAAPQPEPGSDGGRGGRPLGEPGRPVLSHRGRGRGDPGHE